VRCGEWTEGALSALSPCRLRRRFQAEAQPPQSNPAGRDAQPLTLERHARARSPTTAAGGQAPQFRQRDLLAGMARFPIRNVATMARLLTMR
jgi:hypothetical protein